ncbi:response regulator [bacterium]|nr:response regulator [bacterium]HPF36517.1 response regulator [Candidatus Krumholzibacteria bacterium]HRX50808.1 response regulator [Candidatus Krumholzibacteria bacterium]
MKKILVIDDEVPVRKVIARYLEHGGFVVTGVGCADDAVAAVRRETFDLVITDILLPDRNGIDLIQELDRMVPGLKSIAISGGGQIPAGLYLESAENQGASRSLQKPFDRGQLLEAVHALIGEPVTTV